MSKYKIECRDRSQLKSNGKFYRNGDTVELSDKEAKALIGGSIKLFKLGAKEAPKAKPPEAKPPEAKPQTQKEKPKAPAQVKPSKP